MKLGLIGTGLMGAPLAKKILDAGYELNVYNRTKTKVLEIEKYGGKVYSEINQLIKESDAIILILSNYDAIYETLFDSGVNEFDSKIIIQMSTIAPNESIELHNKILKLRGEYFEAPVLGSIPQIVNGELIVLVGSEIEQFEKWKKLFASFSNNILHVGEVGKAAAMKLALNQLIISETVAFSMSLGFVRENELDVNQFMDILRNSALYASTFDKKLDNMLNRDFSNPNFPLKHLLKDLDLM
ncbi:MAG: NAD(P)-dependent oxidoreductase, partial [Ignavibacteriae bacterium]|nr:NAD(P)-dependent oxidoreductase [Ignavibacteriota bacterium]